ncbi:MAG: hypothetical protein JST26_02105 [Bacteroidetes bacterium]|nr:hypothetical protein [Bacteroidota bacterium]
MYKQRFIKYTSACLLVVFSWILFPGEWLHETFADHKDTDDLQCEMLHKSLGTHYEKEHVHCEIFKTHTTLYDCPKISAIEKKIVNPLPVWFAKYTADCFLIHIVSLPARAPPVS